jgi:S1-C subfamily serine protease
VLTLSLLLGIGGLAFAAPSSEDINLWLGAVVLIETGPNLCAGTLIDERGTIATAYHCVASGWTSRVTTLDGRMARAFVLNSSPRDDLAILSAPSLAGSPWLALAEDSPTPETWWWRSGTPRALRRTVGRSLRASSPGR